MAMTDPLGDMLTRIRNGQRAKKDSVVSPASSLRTRVLDVLQREGYIRGYSEEALGAHKGIRIELKYFEGAPAIQHVARVSKPGRRIFRKPRASRYPQRPWHHHRFDAKGRFVGRRSACTECRRRNPGGGILMSRIGKKPVPIPAGVTASMEAGTLSVKGPKGELKMPMSDLISYEMQDAGILVKPANGSRAARAFWGMQRTLVQNLVTGVTEGFTKVLEITGVGYRANSQGKMLKLQLGYSHDVDFAIPDGIEIKTPDNTTVEISGIDKQKVGQVAAEIRRWRKPEPYKGKGIKYRGEYIFRKEGKKK